MVDMLLSVTVMILEQIYSTSIGDEAEPDHGFL